jgi:hypothetical protein
LTRSRVAQTVLGLAVVAAIAAVSFAVRQRQAAPGGSAGDLPDVTGEDAALDLGDVRILVSAGPRPLLAFAPNRFRFRAESGGAPVALAGAVLSFTMAMPMGDHRHALVDAADGWQEAEAALPLCPSGKRRWLGTLDFTLGGRARTARFAFDLAPPPRQGGDGAGASRP